MKTLIGLAVILLLAGGDFVWRGLPAFQAAADAGAELTSRVREYERLERRLDLISEPELQQLEQVRNALAAANRRGFDALLDRGVAASPLGLAETLAATPLSALAAGTPLATEIWELGGTSPHVERALAKVIALLGRHELGSVDIELVDDGQLQPVPGLDRLVALDLQLSVVAALPAVLGVLESLAPGDGEPLLSVRLASLQRVSPDRWTPDLAALPGPPVRLFTKVTATFDGGDRP